MSAEPAPRRWTVTVFGRLPVLNELLRLHPMRRRREMGAWRDWTYWSAKAAGVPSLGRARVTLTRYAPGNRQPDVDNCAGGAKPVIDALQEAHVVSNDDPAHIEVTYRAVRCEPGQARVELVIEEWR